MREALGGIAGGIAIGLMIIGLFVIVRQVAAAYDNYLTAKIEASRGCK